MSDDIFVLGDFVKWESQAGGRIKTKHGTICEIVKSGELPKSNVRDVRGSRAFESYVVHVESEDSKSVYYWPWPKNLVRATREAGPQGIQADSSLFWLSHRLAMTDYMALDPSGVPGVIDNPAIDGFTSAERVILEMVYRNSFAVKFDRDLDEDDIAALTGVFKGEEDGFVLRLEREVRRTIQRLRQKNKVDE